MLYGLYGLCQSARLVKKFYGGEEYLEATYGRGGITYSVRKNILFLPFPL